MTGESIFRYLLLFNFLLERRWRMNRIIFNWWFVCTVLWGECELLLRKSAVISGIKDHYIAWRLWEFQLNGNCWEFSNKFQELQRNILCNHHNSDRIIIQQFKFKHFLKIISKSPKQLTRLRLASRAIFTQIFRNWLSSFSLLKQIFNL